MSPPSEPEKVQLRLYLAGEEPSPPDLVHLLDEAMRARFGESFHLEITDVFENPEQAVNDEVFLTPTLMRVSPKPVRRLIGDLTNLEKVVQGLELPQPDAAGDC